MTDEDVAPEQGELAITRTGDRLRLAREAAGLSLADVATRTRITQRHLSAIEKSDFSELPGRTYVTGFARAYARAVDLPEAEVGAAGTLRAEFQRSETSIETIRKTLSDMGVTQKSAAVAAATASRSKSGTPARASPRPTRR